MSGFFSFAVTIADPASFTRPPTILRWSFDPYGSRDHPRPPYSKALTTSPGACGARWNMRSFT